MRGLQFVGKCANCGKESKDLIKSKDFMFCNRQCMDSFDIWFKEWIMKQRKIAFNSESIAKMENMIKKESNNGTI